MQIVCFGILASIELQKPATAVQEQANWYWYEYCIRINPATCARARTQRTHTYDLVYGTECHMPHASLGKPPKVSR